jgi:hypothetical protein
LCWAIAKDMIDDHHGDGSGPRTGSAPGMGHQSVETTPGRGCHEFFNRLSKVCRAASKVYDGHGGHFHHCCTQGHRLVVNPALPFVGCRCAAVWPRHCLFFDRTVGQLDEILSSS